MTAKAAPMLTAAGAALAADFVKSGLTRGDPVVLARLLSLLTDPLAAMTQQKQVSAQLCYSEDQHFKGTSCEHCCFPSFKYRSTTIFPYHSSQQPQLAIFLICRGGLL